MDKPRRQRKLMRLYQYDYSQNGIYLVTICTQGRKNFFGQVEDERVELSAIGFAAQKCWRAITDHFPDVELDEFVVMPNHIHGIIIIPYCKTKENVGANNYWPLQSGKIGSNSKIPWQTQWSRSLSSIIRGFKIGVSKFCRENGYNFFSWQRSFHDHILREEESLWAARDYIRRNPAKWTVDRNNPRFIKK